MFKKVFNLFKILRKLSISGAVETLDKFKPVPSFFKFIIFIFSIGSAKKVENFSVPNGRPRACPVADPWCRWGPNGHICAAKGVPSLIHTPVTTVDALQRSEGPPW